MNSKTNNCQHSKALAFQELHNKPELFVMPNPWDAGSAVLLAHLGFKALATTSAGLAFSLGKPDGAGAITREETMQNIKSIIAATDLPVSADLENGYGDDPETCAETIMLAAKTGLVGGSIEDATGNQTDPIYSFDLAVERVKAAVKAARSLPFHFTLTARAENLIYGRPDLDDTIKRLEAFAEAGADVLFAPGLTRIEDVKAVINAVAPKPVNIVVGLSGANYTIRELEDVGVRRVSLGSSLARAAYGELLRSAKEIIEKNSIGFATNAVPYSKLNEIFS